MTLQELISQIKREIPRLNLYNIYMVICLIDKELVGRRGYSLTGLEWYYEDNQLNWQDNEQIEEFQVNREAQEVISQTIKFAKKLNNKQLRELVNMEF